LTKSSKFVLMKNIFISGICFQSFKLKNVGCFTNIKVLIQESVLQSSILENFDLCVCKNYRKYHKK